MSQTTPPGPESPPHFDPARLGSVLDARRSQDDRMLAGVCGGVGSYLGIDPVLLRVGFALLTIFGGLGAVAYLALWLLLPEEGSETSIVSLRSGQPDAELRTIVLVIAALLAIGVLGSSAWFLPFHIPWPIFIAVGLWWFLSQRRRRYRRWWTERGATSDLPEHDPHAGSNRGTDPSRAAPDAPPTGQPSESGAGSAPVVDWSQPDPLGLYTQSAGAPVPPSPAPPSLFWPTVGSALVAVGALSLFDAVRGGVAPAAYPLVALGVVGLGLILGSIGARSRGLIPVGALLVGGVLLTSIAPDPRFGHITAAPTTGADIQNSYELTAGEIDIDLTQLANVQDLDRTIAIKVVTGQIKVMVPAGVDVTVESSATAGDLKVLGHEADGTDPELAVAPDHQTVEAPDLVLDLQVGLGQVDVSRP